MVVVAHRGSSGTFPENTMASFRAAAAAGADMIELDVRFTYDMHPVVIHDRTLRRTTSGSGYVWRKTRADVQCLDAGSWFRPAFAGEHVPMLDDVLTWLPAGMGLNIEVKTDGDPRPETVRANALARSLAMRPMDNSLFVSSFDHRFLRRFRRCSPGTSLAVLYMPVRDLRIPPSRLARRTDAGVFVCSRAQLRRRLSADAHQSGIQVAVYGVNTIQDLERVRSRGADIVITDYPELLLRALRST